MNRLQRLRRTLQVGFFALFVLAPALNLLRFDLTDMQLWVLGQRWSLGIDALTVPQGLGATQPAPQGEQGNLGRPGVSKASGQISANQAAIQIFLRGFLPAIALIAGLPGGGLALRPPVLRLAVPALLFGGNAQRHALPGLRPVQRLGESVPPAAATAAPVRLGGPCSSACAWASASSGPSRCSPTCCHRSRSGGIWCTAR